MSVLGTLITGEHYSHAITQDKQVFDRLIQSLDESGAAFLGAWDQQHGGGAVVCESGIDPEFEPLTISGSTALDIARGLHAGRHVVAGGSWREVLTPRVYRG
jgi:hypothetical protein